MIPVKIKKKTHISFRINQYLNTAIDMLVTELKINKSLFIENVLRKYIEDFKSKDKELQKLIIKDRMFIQYEKIREINRCFYIIKNALKTIIDIQGSYLFNSGSINIEIAIYMVDEYKKLYNSFPTHIKKLLHNDMAVLERIKEKEFLIEKIKHMIPMRKHKTKIEYK